MAYYGLRTAWEPMQQLLIPGRFEQQCKAKSMARCLTSLAWNGTLANLLGIIWRPNKNRKQIYEIIIVEEKLKFKASDIGTLSCVCFFSRLWAVESCCFCVYEICDVFLLYFYLTWNLMSTHAAKENVSLVLTHKSSEGIDQPTTPNWYQMQGASAFDEQGGPY